MKKVFTLTLALMATITMWATPTQSYVLTGYSTQITNGKCVNIGGAYCGRKGSNYTPNATYGLPSGNGNVAAVFTVNQTSTITFIMDNQQTSAKSGSVLLASVSDSYYSDCQSGTLGSLPSTASQTKAVSFAKNADSGENEFTFESSVSAGKYIIYWTSSINSSIYLKRIEINSAVKYSVTINPNGGDYASTPDGWTKTDGKYTKSDLSGSFNVPEGLTYSGYDLNGWKDGQGNDITLPITLSHDTTLVAQWAAHQTSSDATLSALSVAGCTLSPAFAPATTAYTIALPFYASMPVVGDVTATKNDSYAADPVVSISDNVITVACEAENGDKLNYTITVNFAPVPTASSSINIEQWVLDNQKGKDDAAGIVLAKALFDAHNIGYVSPHALDSLNDDPSKTNRNEAYLGAKIKAADSQIKVILPASNYLKVKFGNRGATVRVSINGGSPADATITENVYTLPASSEVREVVFSISKASTVVFKQIMINAEIETVTLPWRVTYDAGLGECATTEAVWFGTALVLPEISTLPSGKQFDGWYDAETSGTKVGDAGDTYTPEANVTLYAYYSTATAIDNTEDEVKAVKFFKDGQLFIEKNGHVYNAFGTCIK